MKKAILLLLPFMLVSCNKHSDNTTSSSSHEDITEEVLFERFINKLDSLEGTIKTANVTTDRTISYLTTGGDFFEMKTKTVETKENTVTVCNPPYGERLLEIKQAEKLYEQMGKVFISDKAHFYYQLYNDSNYLYKSVKYTDPSFDDIASKYKMEGSDVESFYAMGFKTETKVNETILGDSAIDLFEITLPEIVGTTLSTVGGLMGPLSMMVIGMGIANMDISMIFTQKRVYLIAALRLIVYEKEID